MSFEIGGKERRFVMSMNMDQSQEKYRNDRLPSGAGLGAGREGEGGGWRVILVGRTGLDQVLRRVAGVELIRTRDSFDALGELSDPIDDASPGRAAVLVAVGAEPEGDELPGFIDGLRMVDPEVKVIRVGPASEHYDGAVEPMFTAAQVLDVIESAIAMPCVVVSRPEPEPEPDTQAQRDQAQRDQDNVREVMKLHQQVMSNARTGAATGTGGAGGSSESAGFGGVGGGVGMLGQTDEPMIDAMGRGCSIEQPAMDLIAARTGRGDISFSSTPVEMGTAVHAGGRVFGSLVCADRVWAQGAGMKILEHHAAWLGGWMRLEAQQRELRLAAFTDELTGAWNRRYFTRFLDAAIEQARGARRTLTLLYFDIDDFKGYNDRYGHAAGDEILVETVRLLESVIRPGDKVCRIGGDEFVVIFYEPKGPRDLGSSPPESIYSLATRFQKQICAHRFPKLGDEASGTLTVSGGLASYPWDGSDGESLLALADELAMKSKRQGKNVITLGRGAEGEEGTGH